MCIDSLVYNRRERVPPKAKTGGRKGRSNSTKAPGWKHQRHKLLRHPDLHRDKPGIDRLYCLPIVSVHEHRISWLRFSNRSILVHHLACSYWQISRRSDPSHPSSTLSKSTITDTLELARQMQHTTNATQESPAQQAARDANHPLSNRNSACMVPRRDENNVKLDQI